MAKVKICIFKSSNRSNKIYTVINTTPSSKSSPKYISNVLCCIDTRTSISLFNRHNTEIPLPDLSEETQVATFNQDLLNECGEGVTVGTNLETFNIRLTDGAHLTIGERTGEDFLIFRLDYTIIHENWRLSFALFKYLMMIREGRRIRTRTKGIPQFYTYDSLVKYGYERNLRFPLPDLVVFRTTKTHGRDTVFRANFHGNDNVFALSNVPTSSLQLRTLHQHLNQNWVSREHILPYHGQGMFDECVYDIFDKYEKTLSSYVWAGVGLKRKIRIIRQIVLGLQSLHEAGLSHGDLSHDNVVRSAGKIKLKGITCEGNDFPNFGRLVLYIAYGGLIPFNRIQPWALDQLCNGGLGAGDATPILCDLVNELLKGGITTVYETNIMPLVVF